MDLKRAIYFSKFKKLPRSHMHLNERVTFSVDTLQKDGNWPSGEQLSI